MSPRILRWGEHPVLHRGTRLGRRRQAGAHGDARHERRPVPAGPGDRDIDCGAIREGASSAGKGRGIFAALVSALVSAILPVASGARRTSAVPGYGRHEFVPWQIGATR